MNFIEEVRQENSAYIQLLRITCYALAGIIAGTILSLLVMVMLGGTEVLNNFGTLSAGNPAYISILKVSQIITTGFLFILPPIWLARSQNIAIKDFYGFKKPEPLLLLVILFIMLVSAPLMEWIGLTNQKMAFPEFLKTVENWMRDKEDEAMKMTFLLLRINQPVDLIVNIFMIAMLPAVGEELFFRGALQRSFTRMFNNPHVAIWVTAFIFSAIHVQFFGFFPRLFLGAAFGYIYLWTGSLWYAMFAHFLNNAFAVCQSWYLQMHHIPLKQADKTSFFPWYAYIISLILSIFLFKYLKDKTTQNNGKQLG
jgi:membrane protease YdiL (CAAX protease family)